MSEQDPAQRPRSYGGGDVLAQAELAALGMQPVTGPPTARRTNVWEC